MDGAFQKVFAGESRGKHVVQVSQNVMSSVSQVNDSYNDTSYFTNLMWVLGQWLRSPLVS